MYKYHISIKRLYNLISIVLLASLVYAIIFATLESQWIILFVSTITFILILIPWLAHKKYNIKIPVEIELIMTLFIYATLFLGEVQDFYLTFWWWDILIHTGSAIVFGFLGFIMIYYIASKEEVSTRPWVLAVFSFSFAIAIGTIWEIVEFTIDQTLGANMQKSGLLDTMSDLIIDVLGAILSSTIAYIYLKTKKTIIFNGIIKTAKRENPNLFSK